MTFRGSDTFVRGGGTVTDATVSSGLAVATAGLIAVALPGIPTRASATSGALRPTTSVSGVPTQPTLETPKVASLGSVQSTRTSM